MSKTIDFTAFTLDELLVAQHELAKAIQAAQAQARTDALEAAREAALAKGFTLEALMGTAAPAPAGTTASGKPRKARAPSTVLYVNPTDASITWNGRGRPPAWYTSALAGGATQESLRQNV